jgi:hypothetical protein
MYYLALRLLANNSLKTNSLDFEIVLVYLNILVSPL